MVAQLTVVAQNHEGVSTGALPLQCWQQMPSTSTIKIKKQQTVIDSNELKLPYYE
jgi:hypothetical protein